MNRWTQKLLSVLICLTLVVPLGATAFADPVETQDLKQVMTDGQNPTDTPEEKAVDERVGSDENNNPTITEDAVITEGDKDNVVVEGDKDNVVVEGDKDNVVIEGAEDNVVGENTKDNVVGENTKDNVVGENTKDNAVGEDTKDNVVIEGAEDNVVIEGAEDNVVIEGAEDNDNKTIVSVSDPQYPTANPEVPEDLLQPQTPDNDPVDKNTSDVSDTTPIKEVAEEDENADPVIIGGNSAQVLEKEPESENISTIEEVKKSATPQARFAANLLLQQDKQGKNLRTTKSAGQDEPNNSNDEIRSLTSAPPETDAGSDVSDSGKSSDSGSDPTGSSAGDSGVEFIPVKTTGSTTIIYGDAELTGTEDAYYEEAGADGAGSSSAWGWSSADGMLSLANCDDGKDITVMEGSLTIQAAGFNRINTLVSESVVNIIGSGILLLEEAKLGEKGEVKLQTNEQYADTGVEGSVAVFLKDNDAAEDNTYKLINGSVPGLLDGSYMIPKGINLVLPSGTSLIMNSSVAVPKEGENNRYQYYSDDDSSALDETAQENASILKISDGASLTVEKDAVIQMLSTESVKPVDSDCHLLTPTIEVASGGRLNLGGKLTGMNESKPAGQVIKVDGMVDIIHVVFETQNVVAVKDPESLIQALWDLGYKSPDEVGFEELKAAWEKVNGAGSADGVNTFIVDENTTVSEKNGEKIQVPENLDGWSAGKFPGTPYTGTGLIPNSMLVTGVGLLFGDILSETPGKNTDNKPTFTTTASSVILPEKKAPAPPEPDKPTPTPAGPDKPMPTPAEPKKLAAKSTEQIPWRLIVTENPELGTWTLSVYAGDVRITDLGVATVRVHFGFDLPDGWNGKNIYVVFLDKNGNLRAIPAAYNAVTGELIFDSNLVGEFVVVTFDYKGELYSKDFYNELAKLDAVKHLLDLHSGKTG